MDCNYILYFSIVYCTVVFCAVLYIYLQGFSLEHPQVVDIKFTGYQLNPNFCLPLPKPTNPTYLVDIYQLFQSKEEKSYIHTAFL